MDIHNRLRQLMEARGWTEYRLAVNSGLSESTIRNLFRRNTVPSVATLELIALMRLKDSWKHCQSIRN